MQKLRMDVYRMDNPDGTPRKDWCYHHDGNTTLTTRWGGVGKALQESSKSCSTADLWKMVREKESKGYARVGSYWVDDNGIDFSGSGSAKSAPVQTAPPPAPPLATVAKNSDALLHWTANDLDGDWQKVIKDALSPVEELVMIRQLDVNRLIVDVDGMKMGLIVRNKRTRGTIQKGKSAWLLALCLFKLSRHLSISVVDDDSIVVDRRYLNSKIDTLGVSQEEFDDAAEKLGLIVSKAFVKANPVIANFF